LNIQIYGFEKNFDTQKTERYFKERKIKYQYIDMKKYGISRGEFESIKKSVGLENLLNSEIKEYVELNLHHIRTNSMREDILVE
jgi:arsenate reductase